MTVRRLEKSNIALIGWIVWVWGGVRCRCDVRWCRPPVRLGSVAGLPVASCPGCWCFLLLLLDYLKA